MSDNRMKIAIVGMSFRFPGGANNEESFWNLLKEGKEGLSEIDFERWAKDTYYHPNRKEPGTSVTNSAGLIDEYDAFDAAFFGISPREARRLDPQQRLLMTLAWEALEKGQIPPSQLAGTHCGVFLGISSTDYGMRSIDDMPGTDAYSMTGNTLSIAANRLSYFFDLRGPSMAIDTACSSSLVALHQACQGLRSGECSTAIAGGVNMLLHPFPFVGFSKASMLSANGKCRAFDADGDGYVRAEGGAVLFLKPMEQALADNDHIQGVILASGANADGGQKSGITIPSPDGQSDLLRQTCDKAGISPGDITYIEAHGTGTAVGDPIETRAIGEVIGRSEDRKHPLYIGSVKTNVGHLEPASGMAGLVKLVLSLQHRALPPSLNFDTPNPHIDFEHLNLKVVTEYTPLKPKQSLYMGVNSFGFGGANAHVLLTEAPRQSKEKKSRKKLPAGLQPLFISAKSESALKELSASYEQLLLDCKSDADYYDLAYAANYHRDKLSVGIVSLGHSVRAIADDLHDYAAGTFPENLIIEDLIANPAKVALVYSGNGAQWLGMGRLLIASNKTFRSQVKQIETLMQGRVDFSLMDELMAEEEESSLALTEVSQPALFAIQVAITEVLREKGLIADVALGHSVGEVAAAWATGALSLEQAVDVIIERSHAQATTQGTGRMAAVALPADRANELIDELGLSKQLEVAGLNSPTNVTLTGDLVALQQVEKALEPSGTFFRLLDLDYAFHSRLMDPIQDMVCDSLAALTPSAGKGHFISTVTGEQLAGDELDANYWWANIRKPVQFTRAVESAIDMGCQVLLEVGPHAIMQRYLVEILDQSGTQGKVVSTLKRDDDGPERLDEAFLRLRLMGAPIDADALFPVPGNAVTLPGYPWQQESYWYTETSEGHDIIHHRRVHPLLGYKVKERDGLWENQLDPMRVTYLADHVVGDAVVMPGTGYIELALAASAAWYGGDTHEVEEIEILSPMVFDADHARTLRFELSTSDGYFRILSRQRLSDDQWTLHVVGRLLGEIQGMPAESMQLDTSALDESEPTSTATDHYRWAKMLGLNFGDLFQGFGQAWKGEGELYARLNLPAVIEGELPDYHLHPVMLDSCFQTLLDMFSEDIESGDSATLLPVHMGRIRLYDNLVKARYCHNHLLKRNDHSVLVDFRLFDETGTLVAELDGCRFRRVKLNEDADTAIPVWEHKSVLLPHQLDESYSPLPKPGALIHEVTERLKDLSDQDDRRYHFETALPLFDALVSAFAFEALSTLAEPGSSLVPSDRLSLDQPITQWLVEKLIDEGLTSETAAGIELSDEDLPSAQDIWLTLLGDDATYLPELAICARIGNQLQAVFQGMADMVKLSDEVQKSPMLEQLHTDSPSYRGVKDATLESLRTLLANWPADRRFRCLTVSSFTAALLHELSRLLPDGNFDLFIAGSDTEMIELEAHELGQDIQVLPLDLTSESSFEALDANIKPFDLIILGQVIDQGSDFDVLLKGIRSLLLPQGYFMATESHADTLSLFLSSMHPWAWTESGKGNFVSSLMTPAYWQRLLKDTGFEEAKLLQEPAAQGQEMGYCLLLGQNATQEVAPVLEDREPQSWLILCDADADADADADTYTVSNAFGLATKLQAELESLGQKVLLATPGDGKGAGLFFDPMLQDSTTALVNKAREKLDGLDQVIQLLGFDLSDESMALEASEQRTLSTLHLVKALSSHEDQPRLWLMTHKGGALAAPHYDGQDFEPAQSSLWGLGRVISNEHTELQCTLLDLPDTQVSEEMQQRLLHELLLPDGENEILLREKGRYVPRMQAFVPGIDQDDDTSRPISLDFSMPGQLRNLEWKYRDEFNLKPDEIEIQTHSVGLNFRDVMYTMGLLSDEAVENGFAGASLGMEVAGTVTRVGSGVADFDVGDQVMAFAPACFATKVVTQSNSAARIPQGWSFEEAATVPAVFFTVYYALNKLAALQPGERILIHGAAGGVGIAAIQYARYIGAEIFATAGSDEKRAFVSMLGADHVMNSRDLSYADQIMEITQGQGVDVVLNSLAGEAINRNLKVLRPFGRFLELGKRDFYENTRIGLRPFKDNISYFGIDADQLMIERPDLAKDLFREVISLFEEGVLRPLPYREFPAHRIIDAFRYMQQSRQIGKIVVTFDDTPLQVVEEDVIHPDVAVSKDASYLISGGLSGFGLATARWLANKGAGRLVLLSRRGADAPGAAEIATELEGMGSQVELAACDVTDKTALSDIIQDVENDGPPLRGVVHAATVFDDGLLRNLDKERFQKVLGPKIAGAWNLHENTVDLPLDFFVLYSSATTFIGNPGQANYVAANAYLEALAAQRRFHGLPATVACWGAIDDVGYLARNEDIKDSLESRLGGKAFTSTQALDKLGEMIAMDWSNLAVMDLGWNELSRFLPASDVPRYDELRKHESAAGAGSSDGVDINELIANKSPAEVNQLVQSMITEELSQILRIPAERLDAQRSLYDLGMDSLMGVELVLGIENRFGFRIPTMALTEGPTIVRISERITHQLIGEDEADLASDESQLTGLVESMAAQHDVKASSEDIQEAVNELLQSS